VALALAQFITLPVYYQFNTEAYEGTDAGSQWRAYLARGTAPDVLFVGDSQTRMDVDTQQISDLLSQTMARHVGVAKIGVGGERPAFLNALVYRVMSRHTHPGVIVLPLNPITSNSATDERWDPSVHLFQISYPIDPVYMQLALRVDHHRDVLIRDWLVPYFRTAPAIGIALQCRYMTWMQQHSSHLPGELRGPTPCDGYSEPKGGNKIDAERTNWVLDRDREWLGDYHFSEQQAQYLREAVGTARSAGTEVVFAVYPTRDLSKEAREASARFKPAATALAATLRVPLFDLADGVPIDDELWGDPVHLNAVGARAFATSLTEILAGSPSLRSR
jgi:hypothetical protein